MSESLTMEPRPAGEADFEAPVRVDPAAAADSLVVNVDGYEGPLDLLLDLARSQRVDLRKLSMVRLVDQYLAFVEAAKSSNLELAADYLVMAAWLAYLKSRLLLPVADAGGPEPSADEMAARLAFQLQRLDAMRKSAEALFALPRLGVNVFARGMPEGVRVRRRVEWRADLLDLLKAYARQRIVAVDRTYRVEPPKVFSIEEARARIARILGAIPEWTDFAILTERGGADAPAASVIASSLNAALEFAKNGRLEIRQLEPFGAIYVKSRGPGGEGAAASEGS